MKDNSKVNVLVIDDEDIVRSLVSDMIRTLGFNVYEFSDPVKAVDFYENNFEKIDLVLLDMIMPNLNGREAFFLLKKTNSKIKAIVLSGYSLNEDVELILKEGCKAYLKKPIKLKDLKQTINTVLNLETKLSSAELEGEAIERAINIPEIDTKEALENLGGNVSLFLKMLEKFVENYKDAGKKMGGSENLQISSDFLIFSHSIKSVAGSLGIKKLRVLAERMESACINKDQNLCVENGPAFFYEIKKVSEKIEEFLAVRKTKNHQEQSKEQVEKSIVIKNLKDLLNYSKINRPKEAYRVFENELSHIFCNKFGVEQKEIIQKKLRDYRFEELAIIVEKMIDEVSNG